MLKTRIIPTLLWKDESIVKGVSFDSWRRVGTIIPAIKVYNLRLVDEMIVLDIVATKKGRQPDFTEIANFSAECFVPLTVGGGIKTIEDVKNILRAGADKISLNSAALENPLLISKIANEFGSQCVVVSIDAKKHKNGKYYCHSHSGTKISKFEVGIWARTVEKMGAGEVLITSIERDGTMKGYDLDLIKIVTKATNIPVIASGGAGNPQDMYLALTQAKASAVAAASMFHFTQQTPVEVKKYLSTNKISVRLL